MRKPQYWPKTKAAQTRRMMKIIIKPKDKLTHDDLDFARWYSRQLWIDYYAPYFRRA